jgi:hypothetical protein
MIVVNTFNLSLFPVMSSLQTYMVSKIQPSPKMHYYTLLITHTPPPRSLVCLSSTHFMYSYNKNRTHPSAMALCQCSDANNFLVKALSELCSSTSSNPRMLLTWPYQIISQPTASPIWWWWSRGWMTTWGGHGEGCDLLYNIKHSGHQTMGQDMAHKGYYKLRSHKSLHSCSHFSHSCENCSTKHKWDWSWRLP